MIASDDKGSGGHRWPAGGIPREDLDAILADPARKQGFVTPMFELIAPRYDRFTRRFSFGMDGRWKRELVRWAAEAAAPGGCAVDIACGTGDLAFRLAAARPDLGIVGVDAVAGMLALARQRSDPWRRVMFVQGDLAQLPLPDASVDLITAGYAFRNAADWRQALGEAARVLRPGGHLLALDFHRPRHPVWREAYLAYLRLAGNVVGWWWHRAPLAYGYIEQSIRHFCSWQEFALALREAGFALRVVAPKLGGGIAIHHAVRVASG